MAWIWESWEEFEKHVQPVVMHRPGGIRGLQRQSWFNTDRDLFEAVRKIEESLTKLRELGFGGAGRQHLPAQPFLQDAYSIVLEAVYAGEELLLLHKRLALSRYSYGFCHQKDIIEHWARYSQTERIVVEADQLVKDISVLVSGFNELVEEDERFIVDELNLPDALEADFRLARNLFSVGFDEAALLITGRGLEGVLRRIASLKRISIETKGKKIAASEADTYDLIETMYHLRWVRSGARLISPEDKVLLHFFRTVRNAGAHPISAGQQRFASSARETAVTAARTAQSLWNEVYRSKARLNPTVVQKTW